MKTNRAFLIAVTMALATAATAATTSMAAEAGNSEDASKPMRVVKTGTMMTSMDPGDNTPTHSTFAECQPLQGDRVRSLEHVKYPGMTGLYGRRVVVLDGRCKGAQGYVGDSYLKAE